MPKERSQFQNKFELFAARLVLGALGLFPLALSLKIGERLGALFYRVAKRLRFVGSRNLALALPELSREEHREILRGSFESLGRQLGVSSHLARLTPEKLRRMIETEGLEFIEKAQAGGRGVILFSGHFGGWELTIPTLPALGFDWSVLVRRMDNALLEELVENLRTRQSGARTIDKMANARRLFRLLQKGGRLGILADLNSQEREGVFVDFFGVPASTAGGLARLALRTGAAVVPFFAIWQEDKKRYLLKICPPLEMPEGGSEEENVRLLTQSVTSAIEDYVRRYPRQWMWIHKRWNTRPPGEPNLYEKDLRVQSPKSKVQSQPELKSPG